jgi:hypothetical protein
MSPKSDLSRAENARQRRAQRTVRGLQETKKRVMRSSTPLVTSRISTKPVVVVPKHGKNRRSFNSAFGLAEVRLHKPGFSLLSVRGGWRQTSAVIAILIGFIIYFALTLPYFHVSSATVVGNIRLSSEEINAVLAVTGQSIFTIQPEEAKVRLLMNYHELASAQVEAHLPNHVNVIVSERQPVILWQQDGGYTWIDSTGVAFRPRGLVAGLIFVNGLGAPSAIIASTVDPLNPTPFIQKETVDPLNPTPFIQKELVDAIIVLAPNVPKDSAMIFDPNYGLGWKDNRGWNAFFGTSGMQDMRLKAVVYQAVVNDLLERGKTPAFISVAYPEAPFYRMTDDKSSQTENSGQ